MEAAPEGVDVEAMGASICSVEGVLSVHELHVWTVTPGFGAMAAHVVVARRRPRPHPPPPRGSPARALRHRSHDAADGGGGSGAAAAGRECPGWERHKRSRRAIEC